MTARQQWKKTWRTIRVIKRETLKAQTDLLLYGTCVIATIPDGDPRHIPLQEIQAAMVQPSILEHLQ